MKATFLFALGLFAVSAPAQQSHGYVFGGVTTIPGREIFTFWNGSYFHAGGGGEAGIGRRFSVGGEVGGLIPLTNDLGRSAAVLSAGPAFHFLSRSESKLDPFVAAGVALLAGRGYGFMVYFGGGANYWFRTRLGLRVEFRDHVWAPESGSTLHFAGVRVGLSFR